MFLIIKFGGYFYEDVLWGFFSAGYFENNNFNLYKIFFLVLHTFDAR